MYAELTQFLTRRGWKKPSQFQKLDQIANYGERGSIEWVSMEHANVQVSSQSTTVFDCKVGRSGKFAITKDHSIRFFHTSKGDDITLRLTLEEVMKKLEVQNSVPGYVPTTFNTSLSKTEQEGNSAVIMSRAFNNIYKIQDNGDVLFSVSRKLSKQQIVDFLIKKLKVPHKQIGMNSTNTAVVLRGWSLNDWYESIIEMPYLLTRVIDDMLYQEDQRANVMRKLRFFCPNVANLAQIAVAFTGRNSRYMQSEVYRNNSHLLIVESKESSVSFRNKVIIMPSTSRVVTTAVDHPITRWKGSITSL